MVGFVGLVLLGFLVSLVGVGFGWLGRVALWLWVDSKLISRKRDAIDRTD